MTVIQCVQLRQDTLIAQVTVPAAQPKIILYKVLLLKSCTPQISFFFFLNDTPPTEIYTLPLHDALPICLAGVLPALHDGGVVLNLGSAVVMPEVFLKALTVVRNLNGGKPAGFTACDCDMQRHYRPRVNVVERPTLAGGRGIQLTGHHELLIPLLARAARRELDGR